MKLDFDKDLHEYRVRGIRVPSVTEILDPLQELDGIPRGVLEAARVFGQHVHEACHLYNQDALDWDSLDVALVPYVEAWQRFLTETGAIVIASEQRVYSAIHRFAGTLDAALEWDGAYVLADIKSGAVPRTVGPQVAAYEVAWREYLGGLTGERPRRYCIQLCPGETLGFRAIHLTDRADWNLFLSALNIHHWRNRNVA